MSNKNEQRLSEINLTEQITLPFWVIPTEDKSDALEDFFIRTSEWVTYISEVLAFSHVSIEAKANETLISPNVMNPHISARGDQLRLPKIVLSSDEGNLSGNLINYLFRHSLSQLVSNYEIFLNELTEEIFIRHDEFLAVDEKQLTTKDIFELGDLDSIREVLIKKKVMDHAMSAYPKRVDLFQKQFFVGIHSKKAPITLAEVHDLMEVRNVIQHSDAHASPQYFKRMGNYKPDYKLLLEREHSTPKVDFEWLLSMVQNLLKLTEYIDGEVAKKWKTSRNT